MRRMKGCTYTRFFKWKKVMPSFEYEPFVLSPKPKTSNEEEERRNKDGAKPLSKKVTEELKNLKGGKDSPKKEDVE
jgi:hypothetical protein